MKFPQKTEDTSYLTFRYRFKSKWTSMHMRFYRILDFSADEMCYVSIHEEARSYSEPNVVNSTIMTICCLYYIMQAQPNSGI